MSRSSEGQNLAANQILSTYLNCWLIYNYFRFWKTNVRYIGNLLSISNSTIGPKSAHYSASGYRFSSKSKHPLRNNVRILGKWLKSKLKVDFQYGGRLCTETGSSYISAADWVMSTKFGLLIDVVLLKAVTSTNTQPEVVFSGRGRQFEKWIWRHISAVGASISTKLGNLMQNNVQILGKWSKSKPKVDF